MTQDEIRAWLVRHGWVLDRFGHYRRAEYRYKVNTHSARYEKKTSVGWVRIRSAYLKNLKLVDGDKLAGMSVWGCGAPQKQITNSLLGTTITNNVSNPALAS